MNASDIRRKIASKEGWQTRRSASLIEVQGKITRARKPSRKKELAAEAKKIRASIRKAEGELADLRRQLSKAKRAEVPISVPPPPPPPPVVPPPPVPPAIPAASFEDRVLELGGGVGIIPDGREHGLVWLDPIWTSERPFGEWLDPLEDVIRHLASRGMPPFWMGRLRIQVVEIPDEDEDIYGARYEGGEGGDAGDEYEAGDSSSPPAGTGTYMPPPPPEERQPRPRGEKKTLTGWTADPMKLLSILDVAGTRLRDRGWMMSGVIVEMVWGASGSLSRGEVNS